MTVPCGYCQACTLAKNSKYAFQCDLESYVSKHTVFVILTYANRFIHWDRRHGHTILPNCPYILCSESRGGKANVSTQERLKYFCGTYHGK